MVTDSCSSFSSSVRGRGWGWGGARRGLDGDGEGSEESSRRRLSLCFSLAPFYFLPSSLSPISPFWLSPFLPFSPFIPFSPVCVSVSLLLSCSLPLSQPSLPLPFCAYAGTRWVGGDRRGCHGSRCPSCRPGRRCGSRGSRAPGRTLAGSGTSAARARGRMFSLRSHVEQGNERREISVRDVCRMKGAFNLDAARVSVAGALGRAMLAKELETVDRARFAATAGLWAQVERARQNLSSSAVSAAVFGTK